MKNGKKTIVRLLIVVAVAVLGTATGILVYINSAPYKAGQQLKLGEKYLTDMEYEQATAAFLAAREIDPKNEAVQDAINTYLEEVYYEAAKEYGTVGDYAAEKEIAVYMLQLDEESISARLAGAEAECGCGNIEEAKDIYDEVLAKDSANEEAVKGKENCEIMLEFPGYQLSPMPTKEDAVYLKELLTLCEAGKWEETLAYMKSPEFEYIKGYVTGENSLSCVGKVNMVLGIRDGNYYVYCGDFVNGTLSGSGVGVISGTETNTIYDGVWAGNMPEGKGTMRIWDKNGNSSEAQIYSANFKEGVMDGTVALTVVINGEVIEVGFDVKSGKVVAFKTDDNGGIWLNEVAGENGCVLTAEYVENLNGVIGNYLAGVPGFGGSDKELIVAMKDVTPPVITCNPGKGWTGNWHGIEESYADGVYTAYYDFMKGVAAIDNIDGDITSQVIYESDINLMGASNWIGSHYETITYTYTYADGSVKKVDEQQLVHDGYVIYTVTDAAGNKATIRVTYSLFAKCGASIKVSKVEQL